MKLPAQLAALAALAAACPAFAQVKLNDTVTITGWAVGSYQYTDPKPGPSFDSLNLDAALFQVNITPPKTPVTAVVSGYFRPSNEGGVSPGGSELTLLDAYVTYAATPTVSVTAGKFLSYLGYESFYFSLDNMISLANQQFLAPIPGYHEGIKVDFTPDKVNTFGVAVVDSLYQKPGYSATEGDGEFKHNGGFEGYYTYNANGLQIWLGVGYETEVKPGYDTSGTADPAGHNTTVFDIWATYTLDKNNDQIVAEEIYKSGGTGNSGSNWLTYLQWNMTSKSYTWFSVAGEEVSDGGPSYVKYSVSPTYNLTGNLAIRAQYSYTSYSKFIKTSANFFGVEGIIKF